MEDWVTIVNLKHKNPKISNRELGRLLGISHNTVKKALSKTSGPVYERSSKVNPDIEPFKEYIEERLIVQSLLKSRVLEELQSKGYQGSKSAFYRYANQLQLKAKRTFKPYETAPGEQAQFDWSPYTIVINGILTKVYVYSCILGYSRYRIYESSLSQSQGSVFEALETSIIEVGGVVQRIQSDNAKCFVINASKDNFQWNPNYLQLCGHYRIKPTRSLVEHPWSKGKVERQFHFLEEHFIKGNEFSSYEEFYSRLKSFQHEVNNRVHSTTRQTPKSLFENEINSLGSLPETRFVHIKEEYRKVSSDCLITYNGNRYSVPHLFATKEVWLKVSQGHRLQVYSSKNILIAEHLLSMEKGKIVINEEHYKNYITERGNWKRMVAEFIALFPEHEWFLDKLKTQKKINPDYHLTRILEFTKLYSSSDIANSFIFCKKYNTYHCNIIHSYLENHCKTIEIVPLPIEKTILASIENVNIKRPLNYYKIST